MSFLKKIKESEEAQGAKKGLKYALEDIRFPKILAFNMGAGLGIGALCAVDGGLSGVCSVVDMSALCALGLFGGGIAATGLWVTKQMHEAQDFLTDKPKQAFGCLATATMIALYSVGAGLATGYMADKLLEKNKVEPTEQKDTMKKVEKQSGIKQYNLKNGAKVLFNEKSGIAIIQPLKNKFKIAEASNTVSSKKAQASIASPS